MRCRISSRIFCTFCRRGPLGFYLALELPQLDAERALQLVNRAMPDAPALIRLRVRDRKQRATRYAGFFRQLFESQLGSDARALQRFTQRRWTIERLQRADARSRRAAHHDSPRIPEPGAAGSRENHGAHASATIARASA